jgi:hypothetical protein
LTGSDAAPGDAPGVPVTLAALQAADAPQPGAPLDPATRWADIYRKSRKFEVESPPVPPDQPSHSLQGRLRRRPKSISQEIGVLLRRNWLLFRNNPAALLLYILLGLLAACSRASCCATNIGMPAGPLFGDVRYH